MVRGTVRQLGPATRAARVVMVTAVAWAVSALVHAGVFVADAGSWAGPVSSRSDRVLASIAAVAKLGARDRAQAVIIAFHAGLVE